MKVLIINGPNLNMLGIREPELYGKQNFSALETYIKESAKELGVEVSLFQSNSEGDLVTCIQQAYGQFNGIVINAGAYTHTSIALLDALKAVQLPTVEVHLTKVDEREAFRKISYIGMYAQKRICGKGFEGYRMALEYLAAL